MADPIKLTVAPYDLENSATSIDRGVRGSSGLSDTFNSMNTHMTAAQNACGYPEVGSALWDATSRLHSAWGSLMGNMDMLAFRLAEAASAYTGTDDALFKEEQSVVPGRGHVK